MTDTITRYVPVFGDTDDLILVDLTPISPFSSGADVLQAAASLQARVHHAEHRIAYLKDRATTAGEELDPRTLERLQLLQDWRSDQLDELCWTASLAWDQDDSQVLWEFTDGDGSHIDGDWLASINADLELIDTFPDPPYGSPLTATLE